MKKYIIYSDGSYLGKLKKGGYASIIIDISNKNNSDLSDLKNINFMSLKDQKQIFVNDLRITKIVRK